MKRLRKPTAASFEEKTLEIPEMGKKGVFLYSNNLGWKIVLTHFEGQKTKYEYPNGDIHDALFERELFPEEGENFYLNGQVINVYHPEFTSEVYNKKVQGVSSRWYETVAEGGLCYSGIVKLEDWDVYQVSKGSPARAEKYFILRKNKK